MEGLMKATTRDVKENRPRRRKRAGKCEFDLHKARLIPHSKTWKTLVRAALREMNSSHR